MKKKHDNQPKMPTHFIMSVIMPCVMLACKDVFKANQEQIDELAKTTERYIGYLADKKVTLTELHKMMEVRTAPEKEI